MIRLSAFADEISPDLDEQIAVLKREQISFIDLRSAWHTNVLDFSDQQVDRIKETLAAHGMGVAAIGSPLGKVPIDSPFAEHLQRLERAIELAHVFQTPFIRVFSFYPPAVQASSADGGSSPWQALYREEVCRRLREMTSRARAAGIVLLHENEKDIYGDTIARCSDILQSCNQGDQQPLSFQAVLDPANFIQCGQTSYPDAYEAMRPWLGYVHVKDALADGTVVAVGEGLARWPELLENLRRDGYAGFLALEPHLAAAGQFSGFSGPELFRRASQTLQQMLHTLGWQYA
ncbi:MAG: sugar phosphate isomerase/epimerase family protein [Ktedonobacteraceae bacterium]